jgi:hypothetical protein
VFITVKIKIILLVLFLGGGIFYALKVWNGTALGKTIVKYFNVPSVVTFPFFIGCPEPIIQEIKHDIHDYLPYHAHHDFTSPDVYSGYPGISSSYPGISSSYSGASGYSGYDSGAYSNTPPPSTGPSNYGVPFSAASSSATASGGSDTSGASNAYLPPNRRAGVKGRTKRAIDNESSQMATDLMFRFLGVNTSECRRRFVCELEFRNPMVEYAMKYIG